MEKSQRLLLTWLIEDTGLFAKIRPYIGPGDFTEEPYAQIAKILFAQYEEGAVNPAKIVSMFPEEEQQKKVASLFHASLKGIETKQEREKALKETIVRIKENSIEYRQKHLDPADIAGLQGLVADKRRLQELQNLHISID